MASLNLGKVGLLLRGDWDSSTDYAALDVVSHEGYSYAARVANKNVEPSAETAAYWQPLAESTSVLATMLGYKNDAADSATAAAGSATAAATSASSATDALANEAADFSSSKAYSIGDYVIYNNGTHKYLYRFTAAHSAGAWVGTDAVQVALADDVSDLKSALNNSLDVSSLGWEIGTMNTGSGTEETSDTRIRSDYVSVTQGTTIKITGNPNCLIVYSFDENKGYLADTTWSSINNSFTVPNGVYYVRLLIRVSVSNQTITSDDIETQYNRCSIALILPQRVYHLPVEVDEINGDITDLSEVTTEITTKTTMPQLEWTSGGYLDAYGHVNSSSSYSYSDFIPVNEGDLLEGNMRFVTAYNANQSALSAYFGNDVSSYTVALPVKYVRISRSTVYISRPLYKTSFTKQNNAFSKITNLETVCNGVQGIRKTGTLSDSSLEFRAYAAIRKGKTYSFYGKVTAFNDLIIGCGTNDVNSSSIEIDTTNITFINASTIINTTAHGLIFSNYIYVIVDIDGNALPKVMIYTDGGMFQKTYTDAWIGASTRVHADADETTTLTGCTLTFSAADVKKTIWYCGDSYMAVRDPGKLPSKLIYFDVFKNINSIGYSGAGSYNVLPYVLAMFEMDLSPKYLIWAIGMNDADTNSAVNSTWKSGYDKLARLANSGKFELVLATIPNTPTINNNFKNAIVRSSGYRYIDFADAVQTAEGENTWLTGMLSSDNVHPTAEGAKALASRLCADFPEIFN